MIVQQTSCYAPVLKEFGFNFFSGVADSLLAPLIEELSQGEQCYIPAPREDLAVGLACGAYLSGRWPVVLMQNSGLGYSLNVLTSLNLIYKIPLLLVVGYRGFEGKDAPEHWVMGQHCEALLQQVGIDTLRPEPGAWPAAVEQAHQLMQQKKVPVAIFIRKGVFSV